MTDVISILGHDVPHRTLAEKATDAREAIRHLLASLDAGEISCETWLLLYEVPSAGETRYITTRSLDSGLTASEATQMVENFKFDTMLKLRDMT